MSWKNSSIDYSSTALMFDEIQNDYLTQTLVFLTEVELKKSALAWKDWIK